MAIKLRIIRDFERSAAFNMAADNYLLNNCKDDETVFLRFYNWEKPSITVGCMQEPKDVLNFTMIEKDGVEWIRRPTGGRAVLHQEDLTYSCIFNKNLTQMGKSISQTYGIITNCLIEGLKTCSIPCDAHDSYDEYKELKREIKLPCFLSPNRDEVMVNGRKLVGSAQKRNLSAVLQHGSVPLGSAYRNLPNYLLLDKKTRDVQIKLLERKSICVNEINPTLSLPDITEALCRGFTTRLAYDEVVESEWSGLELERISKDMGSEGIKKSVQI
ncbi:Lipoate-protein ligase A [Chitinispirillum alkaliphilum]|nr:Lipoate-protein ligase A [Chitinispirillum alkaliphilum]